MKLKELMHEKKTEIVDEGFRIVLDSLNEQYKIDEATETVCEFWSDLNEDDKDRVADCYAGEQSRESFKNLMKELLLTRKLKEKSSLYFKNLINDNKNI